MATKKREPKTQKERWRVEVLRHVAKAFAHLDSDKDAAKAQARAVVDVLTKMGLLDRTPGPAG